MAEYPIGQVLFMRVYGALLVVLTCSQFQPDNLSLRSIN